MVACCLEPGYHDMYQDLTDLMQSAIIMRAARPTFSYMYVHVYVLAELLNGLVLRSQLMLWEEIEYLFSRRSGLIIEWL